MRKYKVEYSGGKAKITLPEIVNWNTRYLADNLIRLSFKFEVNGSLKSKDFENLLKKIPSFIVDKNFNWAAITEKELVESGFNLVRENPSVYSIPVHVWNLIPKGTELIDLNDGSRVEKPKKLPPNYALGAFLPYGFMPKFR